jgi:hypothetical protein
MGSAIDFLDPRTSRRGLASQLSTWISVLVAPLILAGACAAPALAAPAKGGALPTIDVAKNCRSAEAELKALFSSDSSDVYDSCVSDEQAARDQMLKDWDSYPPRVRAACVQTNEYLLSYVEWQSCIEMTRDVLKMRKEAAPAAGKSEDRQCPIVNVSDDGNIISLETRCGRRR